MSDRTRTDGDRRGQRTAWLCALAAAAPLGCSLADDTRTHLDDGKLCLYGEDPPLPHRNDADQLYDADHPIYASVTLGCISACVRNEDAHCTIERSGQTLRVRSVHQYDPPPPEEGCIALCGTLSAVCSSESLPRGSYQIVHGDRTYPLTIPSTSERACR